jgi:hypothetical protein
MNNPASVSLGADGVAFIASAADDAGQVARESREPGADLSDLPSVLRDQIEAVWTPDFVATWQAAHHPAPTADEALAEFNADVDAKVLAVRARGHLFATGPLAGKRVAVRVGTEDAVNWLTLFTGAKDECDLGYGAQPYPGPFTTADGSNVSGLTWQDVLDAMRAMRQFGFMVVGNAVSLKLEAAAGATPDKTQGWPS